VTKITCSIFSVACASAAKPADGSVIGRKPLSFPRPKGLSFEVKDLVLIRDWADLHDVIVAVRIDHGTTGEEYEEVIAFHTRLSPVCLLIMWRNAEAVFLQPLLGERQQYGWVGDALASLRLKHRVILTDITAIAWPTV
jgi:hypothetical protein